MIHLIKRIGLVLVCGLFFGDCYSQNPLVKQWDYRFGGFYNELLTTFQQTTDGGYILGGSSSSDSSGDKTQPNWDTLTFKPDFWIVKINSLGLKQWDKRFGGTNDDGIVSLQQTSDHGYILGGYSHSGISGDKTQANWDTICLPACTADNWIVKVDSLGNLEWEKRFGGINDDWLLSVHQTQDGGYILGGWSNSDSSGDKTVPSKGAWDYWIIKTDSLGNKQWDKDYGGTNWDELYSIQQTSDGGYILGGWSNSPVSGDKTQPDWDTISPFTFDYWIVKIDSTGSKQWDKRFGGTDEDWLFDIHQTADKNYILAGVSKSGINGNKTQPSLDTIVPLTFDYWIIKLDSSGNQQWDKVFGGTDDEAGFGFGNISLTTDGGYLIAGSSYSPLSGNKSENNLGPEQGWIVKTDSAGNKQWDKTIFTTAEDHNAYAIQADDGCYVIADWTNAGIGGYKTQPNWGVPFIPHDYWIVKFCDSTLTTSITQLSNTQLPFSIFPNPTTGTIQLTFNTKHNGAVQCEIWSVMGERVYASPAPLTPKGESARMELDVSFLAKGIYVVRIGDGMVWENKKLVVE